jgi:predicted nucleic acid-binding protein
MSVLIDSCILIDFLSGREPAREYLSSIDGAAISLITWMDVMAGSASPAEEAAIRGLLAAFEVLQVDSVVAEEAVVLRRNRRLKLPGAILYATARVHGRSFATRNTKDFRQGEADVTIPYVL